MRRILVGALAAVFLAVNATIALHRHSDASHRDSCAACAVTAQARSAPTAAPSIAWSVTVFAVAVLADVSPFSATVLVVPARAPPSIA